MKGPHRRAQVKTHSADFVSRSCLATQHIMWWQRKSGASIPTTHDNRVPALGVAAAGTRFATLPRSRQAELVCNLDREQLVTKLRMRHRASAAMSWHVVRALHN